VWSKGETAAVAVATTLLACYGASVALAGSGGETIQLDRADQAAARAAIVRRAELRSKAWTGGPIKPDLTPAPTCRNYHPKQSDLILTGAAESNFRRGLLWSIDSEVKVLRTARMVSVDWRRELLAPGVLACQRRLLGQSFGPGASVVSFARVPFPHVARYATAFRGLVELSVGNGKKARFVVDIVLVSRRRSELSLVTLAPLARLAEVVANERRLVRAMLSRAKP
jgi:hypothetical protein